VLIKWRVSHVDFLNFDFSIGMTRIGQLCRSRVARSTAFHSKDASLETAVRTDSCLISPDFVTEHGQPFTNGECSPLSDIGEAEGIESHVADRRIKFWSKRVLPERGKCRWTEQKRLWDNWHPFLNVTLRYVISDRERRIRYRTSRSHRHDNYTEISKCEYNHAMAYYCSTDLNSPSKEILCIQTS